jgi:hypothetical protein
VKRRQRIHRRVLWGARWGDIQIGSQFDRAVERATAELVSWADATGRWRYGYTSAAVRRSIFRHLTNRQATAVLVARAPTKALP